MNMRVRFLFKLAAIFFLAAALQNCKKQDRPAETDNAASQPERALEVNCKSLESCNYLFTKFDDATLEKLEKLDAFDLRMLRNVIYAKYGQIFKSGDLNTIFKEYSWYKPENENAQGALTQDEKDNINTLIDLENEAVQRHRDEFKQLLPLQCYEQMCQCVCENGMLTKSPAGETFLGLSFLLNKTIEGSRVIEHDNVMMEYAGTWDFDGPYFKLDFKETVKQDDPNATNVSQLKTLEERNYSCKVKVGKIEKEGEITWLVDFYGHGNKYRCRERLSRYY